jgi:hypothetical protein
MGPAGRCGGPLRRVAASAPAAGLAAAAWRWRSARWARMGLVPL